MGGAAPGSRRRTADERRLARARVARLPVTRVLVGLVLVLLASAFTVLMKVFFNLSSDLVGGIDLTVTEHPSGRETGRTVI